MIDPPLVVWVGHDGREPEATTACIESMQYHTATPLHVQRLSEPALRHTSIYRREWFMRDGVRVDTVDHKPFSTDFSFTRFLVPTMMQHRGVGLFCDADFLWRADIAELFELFDHKKAVQVVKHAPLEKAGTKMDGQVQQPYFRKNWSSLVLWNCDHPANQRLTPHVVSRMSGQWLHAFSWLDLDQIGELPHEWNWLAGIDDAAMTPKAVHFTLGVPTMRGHETQPFADEWRRFHKVE